MEIFFEYEEKYLISTGSVPPIKKVAGKIIAEEAKNLKNKPEGAYNSLTTGSKNKKAKAEIPIQNSSIAQNLSWFFILSAKYPNIAEPKARPPINTERIVTKECVVFPKINKICLAQTTWYINPTAPEIPKRRRIAFFTKTYNTTHLL